MKTALMNMNRKHNEYPEIIHFTEEKHFNEKIVAVL